MIIELDTKLSAFEIYTAFKDENHSFILDSAMDTEGLGRYSFVGFNPFKVIKCKNENEDSFKNLEDILKKYKIENNTHLPFVGGAVGYLSYDLCHGIEKLPRTAVDDVEIADMYFGLYDVIICIDHLEGKTYIGKIGIDYKREKDKVDYIIAKIDEFEKKDTKKTKCIKHEFDKVSVKSNFTKKQYIQAIEKIKEYIKNGDIYQVNLTQRFECSVDMNSYELYDELRAVSPAPFGCMLKFDDVHVLSNSPERFIKVNNSIIQTRPIKGTRPRGKNKQEDEMLKKELRESEKDKAELLMIVDLERNDIGRVSEIGSVKVPELFKLEEYANVHHLVATITGKVKDELGIVDVIKGTFPGGSITGAPKIRAMEIIDEIEPTQRNVYTGSVGYIGFDGNADFNIAIRTIVKKEDKVYFQVGGGITWDSNAEDEYDETLHKAKSIMKAIRGYYE